MKQTICDECGKVVAPGRYIGLDAIVCAPHPAGGTTHLRTKLDLCSIECLDAVRERIRLDEKFPTTMLLQIP